MVKEKFLINLIVLVVNKGEGVSSYTIQMFSLPFRLDYEYRYQLIDELINEGYLSKNGSTYKPTQKSVELLKNSNIDEIMKSLLTDKSKVTLDFLLTRWKEIYLIKK